MTRFRYRRRRGAGQVQNALAEQIQDAADPAAIQLVRRVDRIRQPVTGDEPMHGLADQRITGDRLLEPGVSGSPQQQSIHQEPDSIRYRPAVAARQGLLMARSTGSDSTCVTGILKASLARSTMSKRCQVDRSAGNVEMTIWSGWNSATAASKARIGR